jgi:hypothetical protein
VLQEVGPETPSGPPKEVGQAGGQLVGIHRVEAEVVEQVLSELQRRQLRGPDHHDHGGQGDLPLANLTTEENGSRRVVEGADDRTGPAVLGLLGLGPFRPVDGTPRVAPAIEDGYDRRGRGVRKAQQWFHDALLPSPPAGPEA